MQCAPVSSGRGAWSRPGPLSPSYQWGSGLVRASEQVSGLVRDLIALLAGRVLLWAGCCLPGFAVFPGWELVRFFVCLPSHTSLSSRYCIVSVRCLHGQASPGPWVLLCWSPPPQVDLTLC